MVNVSVLLVLVIDPMGNVLNAKLVIVLNVKHLTLLNAINAFIHQF